MKYICNPVKNTKCRQTGCLFCLEGECFSTLNPEYAVKDADGQPVSYEDEDYEKIRHFMVTRYQEAVCDAMYKAILFGRAKE